MLPVFTLRVLGLNIVRLLTNIGLPMQPPANRSPPYTEYPTDPSVRIGTMLRSRVS